MSADRVDVLKIESGKAAATPASANIRRSEETLERLVYIEQMLFELAGMARTLEADFLGYLISIAHAEAVATTTKAASARHHR